MRTGASYVATPREYEMQSGSDTPITLKGVDGAANILVYKAVVTNKDESGNLVISVDADNAGLITLFPGQSYTLEPGNQMRFNLSAFTAVDEAHTDALAVHILYWM